MHEIENSRFSSLISPFVSDYYTIISLVNRKTPETLTRPILGRLYMEAGRCEELLDSYGANSNKHWFGFRELTATSKTFSKIAYNLCHLLDAGPRYRLVDDDTEMFLERTEKVLNQILESVYNHAETTLSAFSKMKLTPELKPYDDFDYMEPNFKGKLTSDLKIKKKGEIPREITVYLATSFLNLVEESTLLKVHTKAEPDDYASWFPETINEESLRQLENKFHNLQSIYDTYLGNLDPGSKDSNLPTLRGQISIVYHLLDTATKLVHYYERHCQNNCKTTDFAIPLKNQEIYDIVIRYFITFSDQFVSMAQGLCKEILKSYAEMGKIEVAIPNYRGFHVRPSTLIAKIVYHYGSDVKMTMGKNIYNAAMPLELFRANEEINLNKRAAIARNILQHKLVKNDINAQYDPDLMKKVLRIVFLDLLEKQKIMIYDNDFSFDDLNPYEKETLAEFAKRGIAMYMALGKIDIISDVTVFFEGDKRVLEDIKTLAENGYGEDKFGNNIVLPPLLSYLRR